MRSRVTVTIRKDLLQLLDTLVDREKIRNRSHALEYVLSRAIGSGRTTAVILASGKGINMRPFTYEIPKPLIPVRGRPLLEHSIDLLRSFGFRDIVLTVSHLADKIKEYFGDGSRFGVSIQYVHEKHTSGTGGALWHAQGQIHTSPFLLLYADVLADIDLTELLRAHQAMPSSVATLALTPVPDPSLYGAARLRGTKIVDFIEKPKPAAGASHLVFSGMGVFDQRVFDYFPAMGKKGELSLERSVFPNLIDQGVLNGYLFDGRWFDVSTPKAYERALREWDVKHI